MAAKQELLVVLALFYTASGSADVLTVGGFVTDARKARRSSAGITAVLDGPPDGLPRLHLFVLTAAPGQTP